MAERPIYIPKYDSDLLVETKLVEFNWFPGMAPVQKQKSINSLHESAKKSGIASHPLEVSSKSLDSLGVQLTAFNLIVKTEKYNREYTVESAYQSSKIFENGEAMASVGVRVEPTVRLGENAAEVGLIHGGC